MRSAHAALVFLVRASLRNRLQRQLQRLRHPRYAVALLIGLAYFGFLFYPDDPHSERDRVARALLDVLAPLLIAFYLAWAWLWGGQRNVLGFSAAEVQHLFTAPLRRRDLIRFQLLRSQLRIAFSALLFTIILDRLLLPWWLRLPALWLLFATLQLHQIAASLVHVSTEQAGVSGVRRHLAPIVLFVAMGLAVAWSTSRALPEVNAAGDGMDLATRIGVVLREPVAAVALFPFRLLLDPILAPTAAAWTRALPGALALLLLHYIWVLRTDTAFEEAAAESARRRARRMAAMRAGGRRAPAAVARPRTTLLPLRGGAPWSALIWKNLIAFVRGMRRNTLVVALVLLPFAAVLGLAATESVGRAVSGLATIALVLAVLLFVTGPLAVRNDLRQDLARVSMLRTWPLSGSAIVGAEVASAALVLGIAQLALIAVSLGAFAYTETIPPAHALLIFAAALLVTTPLSALALVVQNGLALHFPDWMRVGMEQPGGVEFMGQHILRLVGTLLLVALGLIPPLLLAGWAALQLLPALGAAAALPAALAGIAALWLEVVAVVTWLGRAFERIDLIDAGLRA